MSERTAEISNRARRNGISSCEAWEDLRNLAAETEWDVEHMLSDSSSDSDSISDTEVQQ